MQSVDVVDVHHKLGEIMIKFKQQISPTTCGQTCLAMILDIDLVDSILLVGHKNPMSCKEMKSILEIHTCYQMSTVAEKYFSISKKLNKTLLCYHIHPSGATSLDKAHWTLFHNNTFLDPAKIPNKKRWPLAYFIPLNLEDFRNVKK